MPWTNPQMVIMQSRHSIIGATALPHETVSILVYLLHEFVSLPLKPSMLIIIATFCGNEFHALIMKCMRN